MLNTGKNKIASKTETSGIDTKKKAKFLQNTYIISVLLLITVLINIPSFFYKLTGCDDVLMISNANALMNQSESIFSAFAKPYMFESGYYYRPIVMLSLFPDLLLGGSTAVFHVLNVFYFSISVILVYFLLLQLKMPRMTAFIASSLFAVNPVYSNSIAWIPGRNDILLTIFSLAFFLFVLKSLECKKTMHMIFACLFLLLALFTKEVAAAFALFAVGYVYFISLKRSWKFNLSIAIPVFLCITAWFMIRSYVVTQPVEIGSFKNSAYLIQGLGKIVFPFDLTVLPTITDTSWIPGIAASLIIIVVIAITKKENLKLVIAGLAWFIITLFPAALNRNPEYSADLMVECRLMLPSVGVLIVVFGSGVLNRIPMVNVKVILFAAFFAAFSFFNVQFSSSYVSGEAFWKTAANDSKHLDLSFAGLGLTYLHADRWQDAEINYMKAVELNPAKPGYNGKLGFIKLKQNDADAALTYFLNELKLNSSDYESNLLAGIILFKKGDLDQSKPLLLSALKFNQSDYQPAFYLMKLSYQQHDKTELNKYVQIVKSKGVKVPDEILKEVK